MNGLVSDYYNLTGQKNINVDDITLTGKFMGSNSNYFIGLSGNIQAQINALSTNSNTIIYYGISSYFSNVNNTIITNTTNQNIINTNIYGSISGSIYNINNIINNNQTYNNNIYNYITNYLNSISGNIISINNNITNNNNNNNIIYSSLSGIIYGSINTINNNNIINYNSILSLSGLIYSTIINNSNSILSLSGLINYNYVYQGNINQNYQNYFLSLSGKIASIPSGTNGTNGTNGRDGKDASVGLSSANTIGNIVNGIATFGLGAATAATFAQVFASLGILQGQESVDHEIDLTLQGQINTMKLQIQAMKYQIEDLQIKCCYLNGSYFDGDFIIGIKGSLQNIGSSYFNGKAIFKNDVTIRGNLLTSYNDIQQFTQ